MRFTIRALIILTFLAAVSLGLYHHYGQSTRQLLPTPELAFEKFADAAISFQASGDRKQAARQFGDIKERYLDTEISQKSGELATLLGRMQNEDSNWREPLNPNTLALEQRIDYLVYHLRNAECYQMGQPGACWILEPSQPNSAHELLKIGKPAVPKLIELLEDRRPIRAVGYWRDFCPSSYTLLRYQDVAMQILHEIYDIPAYKNHLWAEYHSDETPEMRKEINDYIEKQWKNSTLNDAG